MKPAISVRSEFIQSCRLFERTFVRAWRFAISLEVSVCFFAIFSEIVGPIIMAATAINTELSWRISGIVINLDLSYLVLKIASPIRGYATAPLIVAAID